MSSSRTWKLRFCTSVRVGAKLTHRSAIKAMSCQSFTASDRTTIQMKPMRQRLAATSAIASTVAGSSRANGCMTHSGNGG